MVKINSNLHKSLYDKLISLTQDEMDLDTMGVDILEDADFVNFRFYKNRVVVIVKGNSFDYRTHFMYKEL